MTHVDQYFSKRHHLLMDSMGMGFGNFEIVFCALCLLRWKERGSEMGSDEDVINLNVKWSSTGESIEFKVKMKTEFGKVRKALAQKFGVEQSSFRLLMDGQQVTDTQTPKMVEMEDGDQLDAVLEQLGGGK